MQSNHYRFCKLRVYSLYFPFLCFSTPSQGRLLDPSIALDLVPYHVSSYRSCFGSVSWSCKLVSRLRNTDRLVFLKYIHYEPCNDYVVVFKNIPLQNPNIQLSCIFKSNSDIRGGAGKSLARPTSRFRRTESIVSLERGACSCTELQVFSCYRG